jgi:hypothetical protein
MRERVRNAGNEKTVGAVNHVKHMLYKTAYMSMCYTHCTAQLRQGRQCCNYLLLQQTTRFIVSPARLTPHPPAAVSR